MKFSKLSELFVIKSGGTPSRSHPEYYCGSIPWAKIGDIENANNGIVEATAEKITEESLSSIGNRFFPAGTLLLAMYGSVGKVAFCGIAMSINQAILGLQKKNDAEVSTKYVYYWFKANNRTLRNMARGGILKNLSATIVKDIKIPIPPLDDQIRIATLLSRIEGLIATRKDNLRLLDEFLKSTFLEMFGEPVRNEKGFEIRRLSEFYIDPKNGTKCGPFGSALKKEEYVKSGIPVWNMDNISTDGRLQPDICLWITDKKYEELKGYSATSDDIIISRAGTVGKMCVLNSDHLNSIISTNLIRVRFGKGLLPIYFVSLMTYCKGRVGNLRTGADGSFTHMNTGILDRLSFPYPPIELQNQFATIVEKVESLKTIYDKNLSEIENLYGALSQKAFKGELDLNRIPLDKVPEETVLDATPEPSDQFPKLDSYAMSDPAARERLLRQLFDTFIAEGEGGSFSMKIFWTQAEQKVLDHMDDESPPLGVGDYDKVKEWLFELVKRGHVRQHFYEENNYMGLSIKG